MTKKVQVIDSEYPDWTSSVQGAPVTGAPTVDETPAVQGLLSDVLGWRIREDDPTAFQAALKASFELSLVQGHTVSAYRPQGYATMADMGAVTGGQASLYMYAQALLTPIVKIVNGLKPLKPDADLEDCDAFKSLIVTEVQNIVQALGEAGGPIVSRVDTYFGALIDWTPGDQLPGVTEATVRGQLNRVRTIFGFDGSWDNSPQDEQMRTSFRSLTDFVVNFARAWDTQRSSVGGRRFATAGYIGTDLVLISRALAAADSQVTELEAIIRSTLIADSEWSTIALPIGGMTLADLINWLHIVLGNEATTIIQSGRDGVETSLTPIVRELYLVVRKNLWRPTKLSNRLMPKPLVSRLPAGMSAARTRIGVQDLLRLMHELVILTGRVHRNPLPIVLDARILQVLGYGPSGMRAQRSLATDWSIEVELCYGNRGQTQSFATQLRMANGKVINAMVGSTSEDADSVTAEFLLPAATTAADLRDMTVEMFDTNGRVGRRAPAVLGTTPLV